MNEENDRGDHEMLPFEDQARQDVAAEHHKELAESAELLQFALRMLGSDGQGGLRIPSRPVPGVTDRARSLALGLYAKGCKQFRGIVVMGERGFGGEVTVLTRALFETTLAVNFIINETVTLKRDGKDFDPDPSRPLTTDFRALLYGAHAGDGFMHFDLDDDGAWLDLAPSPAGIGGLLRLAGLVFLGCLTGVHNRLNFGSEVESALNDFARRFNVPDN